MAFFLAVWTHHALQAVALDVAMWACTALLAIALDFSVWAAAAMQASVRPLAMRTCTVCSYVLPRHAGTRCTAYTLPSCGHVDKQCFEHSVISAACHGDMMLKTYA